MTRLRHAEIGSVVNFSIDKSILNRFGIDAGQYSFGYLASWQGGEGAIRTLKSCAARIQRTACEIIDAIEGRSAFPAKMLVVPKFPKVK